MRIRSSQPTTFFGKTSRSKKSVVCLLTLIIPLAGVSVEKTSAAIPAPTCKTIVTNPAVTKGILLNCLDGRGKFIFQSIRGPAILNVWGSWCFPCREEIPYLVQIAKTKKVQIIGIDASEKSDAAGMAFVKAHDMTWPQLSDIKNKTKGIFGLGVPVSRFIDVDGKVVYEKIGPFKSVDEIKKAAKEFLGIKF